MRCDVGGRHGLDPVLLCLWCRPAANSTIPALAGEPPTHTGVDLKSQKKKKNDVNTKYENFHITLTNVIIFLNEYLMSTSLLICKGKLTCGHYVKRNLSTVFL